MRNTKRLVVLTVALVALALIVGACKPEPEIIEKEVTREVMVEVTKEVVKAVEVEVEVTRVKETKVEVEVAAEPVAEIPFAEKWVSSGHADTEAEAFRHWDEDDPAVVPASCAKCHSEGGYLDFLGVDGTEAGVVDGDAEIGTVVSCVTCHNEATVVMDSVVFPSGVEVAGLGDESRCMQCHQGRASTASVDRGDRERGRGETTRPARTFVSSTSTTMPRQPQSTVAWSWAAISTRARSTTPSSPIPRGLTPATSATIRTPWNCG